jgi:cell wall-associated NlpC family hydrolase
MFNLDDMVGLPYVEGQTDCYTCVRNFYRRYGLLLPNFARPQRFWMAPDIDLYGQYKDLGFHVIFDQEPEPGDLLLMPIMAPINSHGAISLGDNKIIHHPPHQLSRIEPYRPKWSNRTTIHARHPDIYKALRPAVTTVQLHEVSNAPILRNPEVQGHIESQLSAGA